MSLRKMLMLNQNLDQSQGGITCGAIDEPRKSSKAIDKRVIINFRDKNAVIARFRNNFFFLLHDKNAMICHDTS